MAVPLIVLALAGCGSSSESQVRDALEASWLERGAPGEVAAAYADCAAPRVVEELDDAAIEQVIADPLGATLTSEDDLAAFNDVRVECAETAYGR